MLRRFGVCYLLIEGGPLANLLERVDDGGFGRGLGLARATGIAAFRRHAAIALLVLVGYYAGARLGLALTFAPQPISVLWPPNAILFASLILVPRRQWWLVLAAAFPAHLVAEMQMQIPAAMALSWYASNVTEALIGATILRYLIGDTQPFETLQNVLRFLLAAAVATVLSSFLDAALVVANAFGTRTYWEMWVTRLFSNLSADLIVVPVVVTVAAAWPGITTRSLTARSPEAACLVIALATITILVFDTHSALGAPAAQILLPLPFLMWAALRFGPTGASVAFTAVALAAIWGAGHGLGALGEDSPAENAHAVQLLMLSLGPTLLCLAAAIVEVKRGLESVRASDGRFRMLLEATKDTMYEHDLRTGDLRWSAQGGTQFGYANPDDFPRAGMFLPELMHEDDRDHALEQQEEALRGGRALWEAEYRFRRANGTYAHVHEQGFIVRDAKGRPVQTIGTINDLTERHRAEELDQRLAHASRLTAMGELAASIAHEINQPMAAILNNVEAAELLLRADKVSGQEMLSILADIRSDDLRASEIVRHIRGLANVRDTALEMLDVNEVARSVLRLAMPTARRRGIRLRGVWGPVATVRADRVHVEQVLLNLILNGMDAMRGKTAASPVLTVMTFMDDERMVRIAVRDAGHGIAPENAAKIFDSFFTTKPDGMGLGLSIARSLVAAQGGRLWAENNTDRGATFSFTLPAGH